MVALTRNIESENLLLSEQRDAAMTQLQTTCAALEDVSKRYQRLADVVEYVAGVAVAQRDCYLIDKQDFETLLFALNGE